MNTANKNRRKKKKINKTTKTLWRHFLIVFCLDGSSSLSLSLLNLGPLLILTVSLPCFFPRDYTTEIPGNNDDVDELLLDLAALFFRIVSASVSNLNSVPSWDLELPSWTWQSKSPSRQDIRITLQVSRISFAIFLAMDGKFSPLESCHLFFLMEGLGPALLSCHTMAAGQLGVGVLSLCVCMFTGLFFLSSSSFFFFEKGGFLRISSFFVSDLMNSGY